MNKYYDLFNKTLALLNGNEQDKNTEIFDKVCIARDCDYFFNECNYMRKIKNLTQEQQEQIIDIIYEIYANSTYDTTNLYVVCKTICNMINNDYISFENFIDDYENNYEDFYENFDTYYTNYFCD